MGGTAFIESHRRPCHSPTAKPPSSARSRPATSPTSSASSRACQSTAQAADGNEVAATLLAMPDYLAVGSDDDFVRMPMTPQTAQQIADQFGCTLPTRKIVDAIDARRNCTSSPAPSPRTARPSKRFSSTMKSSKSSGAANRSACSSPASRKTSSLRHESSKSPSAWRSTAGGNSNGQPIQPLTIVHWDSTSTTATAPGWSSTKSTSTAKKSPSPTCLADPERCGLVSDEGPMKPPRYLP